MKLPHWILITTAQDFESLKKQIQIAVAGSCPHLQIRLKNIDLKTYELWMSELKALIPDSMFLTINDRSEIAQRFKSQALHLGKKDLHPVRARNLLGPKIQIGITLNSLADAKLALKYPVGTFQYAGVGPWRFTTTKENLAPILCPLEMKQIIEHLSPIPCFAIGGLKLADAYEIQQMGFYGAAVASAIWETTDPIAEIQKWNQKFHNFC